MFFGDELSTVDRRSICHRSCRSTHRHRPRDPTDATAPKIVGWALRRDRARPIAGGSRGRSNGCDSSQPPSNATREPSQPLDGANGNDRPPAITQILRRRSGSQTRHFVWAVATPIRRPDLREVLKPISRRRSSFEPRCLD
jgi:hypothetical protein